MKTSAILALTTVALLIGASASWGQDSLDDATQSVEQMRQQLLDQATGGLNNGTDEILEFRERWQRRYDNASESVHRTVEEVHQGIRDVRDNVFGTTPQNRQEPQQRVRTHNQANSYESSRRPYTGNESSVHSEPAPHYTRPSFRTPAQQEAEYQQFLRENRGNVYNPPNSLYPEDSQSNGGSRPTRVYDEGLQLAFRSRDSVT